MREPQTNFQNNNDDVRKRV